MKARLSLEHGVRFMLGGWKGASVWEEKHTAQCVHVNECRVVYRVDGDRFFALISEEQVLVQSA